jgi:tripartite ATP-independent transporter DctM subunit
MIWWHILLITFGGLLLLFMSGLPVFACFMIMNVGAVLYLMGSGGLGLFVNSMLETTTAEPLVAIPMFILLGELLFRSGGVTVLFEALDRLVGAIRGRLYIVAVGTAAVLGAISGSAMAASAILGRFVYPTLVQRGCDRKLAIGTVLAGASLDPIIPPSVMGIVLATLANISVANFLVAGIVPGLFLAGLYAGYAVVRTIISPELDSRREAPMERASRQSRLMAAISVLPLAVIILLVMGLVMLGIAQPTEAAAAGILGAVAMSIVFGTYSTAMLRDACIGAAKTTSAILIIIASSKLFSQVLAFTGATGGIIDATSGLAIDAWLFYVAMMVVIFLMSKFIDALAIMLIVVPIYAPIVNHLGFDPIWFWMMFLINLTFGGITPPLGYTIFVFQSAQPGVPLLEIYRAVVPMLLVALFGVIVLSLFPTMTTWLPSLQ